MQSNDNIPVLQSSFEQLTEVDPEARSGGIRES